MSESNRGNSLAPAEREDGTPEQRRQSPRYRLRTPQADMSWDDGGNRVASEAEVINMSGGGAAVLASRRPQSAHLSGSG